MDVIRAGLCERLEHAIWIFDHQMHVQREFGNVATCFYDDLAHCDGGCEMPIHHVDVDPIGACQVGGGNLLAQMAEICAKYGWSDQWLGSHCEIITKEGEAFRSCESLSRASRLRRRGKSVAPTKQSPPLSYRRVVQT